MQTSHSDKLSQPLAAMQKYADEATEQIDTLSKELRAKLEKGADAAIDLTLGLLRETEKKTETLKAAIQSSAAKLNDVSENVIEEVEKGREAMEHLWSDISDSLKTAKKSILGH